MLARSTRGPWMHLKRVCAMQWDWSANGRRWQQYAGGHSREPLGGWTGAGRRCHCPRSWCRCPHTLHPRACHRRRWWIHISKRYRNDFLFIIDTWGCGLGEDVVNLRFELDAESSVAETELVLVVFACSTPEAVQKQSGPRKPRARCCLQSLLCF